MTLEHVDVLIVGAGLSGIGAGYHLQAKCPNKTYLILEGRDCSGGTWDLFRYPGVRSDSDMHTLGYSFRPWTQAKAIADGSSILEYVRATARDYGIDRKIRFDHQVRSAAWSTPDARWTVTAERGAQREQVRFTCNFLFMCSGYYDYAAGYLPEFPGIDRFAGRVVHPQKWPKDFDCRGKRVVVIGSGATAVTLVPEMAKSAAHVTMLQRSPTYVVSRPARDRIANGLRKFLPTRFAHAVTRWKNVLLGMLYFSLARRRPALIRKKILNGVSEALGPDYDVARHFTPRYNPWDQRICLAPDGDLFQAIKLGRAAVVTDRIETFLANGIKLQSGAELPADVVVTATGLNLQVLGGMQVSVDGRAVDFAATLNYKGMMYSDVPNLAASFGYTNASWTLKCDLTCEYVCRLLDHMDANGFRQCVPRNNDPSTVEPPRIDFSPGYVRRSLAKLPRQGSRKPWCLQQNYLLDMLSLRYAAVDDGVMEFSGKGTRD